MSDLIVNFSVVKPTVADADPVLPSFVLSQFTTDVLPLLSKPTMIKLADFFELSKSPSLSNKPILYFICSKKRKKTNKTNYCCFCVRKNFFFIFFLSVKNYEFYRSLKMYEYMCIHTHTHTCDVNFFSYSYSLSLSLCDN